MDSIILSSGFLRKIMNFNEWERIENKFADVQQYYYPELSKISQIGAREIIQDIKQNRFFNMFVKTMNDLNEDELFFSYIHGKEHIYRVCILAFFISLREEQPRGLIKDVLEVAKYHDIGRIDDTEDAFHGKRGAYILAKRRLFSDAAVLQKYQAVISAHSLPDDQFNKEWKFWGNKDQDKPTGSRILNILKDADALDRFRLSDFSLETRYLRENLSIHMIKGAYELCHLFH